MGTYMKRSYEISIRNILGYHPQTFTLTTRDIYIVSKSVFWTKWDIPGTPWFHLENAN